MVGAGWMRIMIQPTCDFYAVRQDDEHRYRNHLSEVVITSTVLNPTILTAERRKEGTKNGALALLNHDKLLMSCLHAHAFFSFDITFATHPTLFGRLPAPTNALLYG